ncbi:hypothetical protein ACLB2K_013956 [Fragaria x ananassa]
MRVLQKRGFEEERKTSASNVKTSPGVIYVNAPLFWAFFGSLCLGRSEDPIKGANILHRLHLSSEQRVTMYLQFYINENGDKVYTTKKESPLGLATQSAHPGKISVSFHSTAFGTDLSPISTAARFSPDDKYSRQRYLLKKRFGLLPTQQSPLKY